MMMLRPTANKRDCLCGAISMPLLASACAAGSPSDPGFEHSRALATQSGAIQSGYTDFTEGAAVGVMVHRSSGRTLCSGTLVSPNVVLVAQHCLGAVDQETVACGQRLGPNVAPGALEVTTAVSSDHSLPDDAGAVHAVQQIEVAPGGDDVCGFDVAMLVLATPCEPTEAIAFRLRATPAMTSELYSAIGYGKTCGDASAEVCYLESGTRRRLAGLSVSCTADCPRDRIAATEWRGERGLCLGTRAGLPWMRRISSSALRFAA